MFLVLITAVQSLMTHPLRTLLASLGIVIGVSSVIAMLAIGSGARSAVDDNFRTLGSDNVRVAAKREFESGELVPVGQELTYEDALLLPVASDLVRSVRLQTQKVAKARHDRSFAELAITGAMADQLENIADGARLRPEEWEGTLPPVAEDFMAEGRFFSEPEVLQGADVCVLGAETAEQLFLGAPAVGSSIRLDRRQCVVIGVLAALELTDPSAGPGSKPNEAIYAPISMVINSFFDEPPPLTFTAIVTDEARMDDARLQIAGFLREAHGLEPDADGLYDDDFSLTTRDDVLGAQQASARTFSLLIATMAGISLLVGGIGIMNVMLVSVTERTREIGVRMAVGARPGDVIAQFLAESIAISALGGAVGAGIGIGAIPLVGRFVDGDAQLVASAIPLAISVALLTGVFFGIYPAVRASRLDPIQALRQE